jgi:hypothetical protein
MAECELDHVGDLGLWIPEDLDLYIIGETRTGTDTSTLRYETLGI